MGIYQSMDIEHLQRTSRETLRRLQLLIQVSDVALDGRLVEQTRC